MAIAVSHSNSEHRLSALVIVPAAEYCSWMQLFASEPTTEVKQKLFKAINIYCVEYTLQ